MTKKARIGPVRHGLYREVRAVLESARRSAYRAVNVAMVHAYWQVGRLIVESEQGGRKRAAYGESVLEDLSRRLTTDFGRGFDVRNLRYMRQFYLAYPRDDAETQKRNAVRSKLPSRHALRDKSAATRAQSLPAALRPELSWTHYRLLLGVEDPQAREWYLRETADQHWSTRQLERQIAALY